jgi:hypothetical protein
MIENLRNYWEKWQDSYWRLDHPEITAIAIALATGLIGLLFAYLQHKITTEAHNG